MPLSVWSGVESWTPRRGSTGKTLSPWPVTRKKKRPLGSKVPVSPLDAGCAGSTAPLAVIRRSASWLPARESHRPEGSTAIENAPTAPAEAEPFGTGVSAPDAGSMRSAEMRGSTPGASESGAS